VGFLLLQKSLQLVSVSFAVTCRGVEPVVTCMFSFLYLSEPVTAMQWLSTFLIVVGVGFCAGADTSWNYLGLVVLFLCNVCFSLRSLLVKFMHRRTRELGLQHLSGQKIYYVTCTMGCLLMICLNASEILFGHAAPEKRMQRIVTWVRDNYPLLAVNSACFTLYNVASYILLGKIPLSHHAIGNAVRQVVVITVSIVVVGSTVAANNVVGILCVAVGAACYSIFKQANGAGKEKTAGPGTQSATTVQTLPT